jgi:hypothetical protein
MTGIPMESSITRAATRGFGISKSNDASGYSLLFEAISMES